MPLVSMRQLLDHAAENGYGIPAFNVNNLEQVQAVMTAAAEVGAPVILQASAGARKYAGESFIEHLILAAVEAYPKVPLVMHQDHGQSPEVCRGAIDLLRHLRRAAERDYGGSGTTRLDRWTQIAVVPVGSNSTINCGRVRRVDAGFAEPYPEGAGCDQVLARRLREM